MRLSYTATIVAMSACLSVAAPKEGAIDPIVDVGSYAIKTPHDTRWTVEVHKDRDYAVFFLSEKPHLVAATLGVFRLVVPAAATGGDKREVAAAYAVHDVSGVQKALFGDAAKLVSQNKKPQAKNGALVFAFDEIDSSFRERLPGARFTQAFVLFPTGYSSDGAIFLILNNAEVRGLESELQVSRKIEDIMTSVSGSSVPALKNDPDRKAKSTP